MGLIASDSPLPSQGLRSGAAIEFYCDESCQNAHRFLVIGVLAVVQSALPNLLNALGKARANFSYQHEVGWTKVSSDRFGFYLEWLDVFRRFAKKRQIRMTALILDTEIPANRRWDSRDRELGFSKLLYQLLLHRVGRKYGSKRLPIYGYLDSRETKHMPDKLAKMLNLGLRKDFNISCFPFRRITFQNSKTSDLIQLVDLLIGGIAFYRNNRASDPGVRQAKIDLSVEVMALQQELAFHGSQFSFWEWEYKHKIPGA